MANSNEEQITALRGELCRLREQIKGDFRETLIQVPRNDLDRLVPIEEAASLLGMTSAALRKAVERGEFPARRVGRRLRFRIGDLLLMQQSV